MLGSDTITAWEFLDGVRLSVEARQVHTSNLQGWLTD